MHPAKKPWSELQIQLNPQISKSLRLNNFVNMMPVQEACIPLLLKNYDLAVEAQTGSGKTLAFVLPLLQRLLKHNLQNLQQTTSTNGLTAKYVILSPTRQLCQQTFDVLSKILKKISNGQNYLQYCFCVTGGKPLSEDLESIREKGLVVIGTVGRVKELLDNISPNWLKKTDYLYIDEADRVLKEKGIDQLIKSFQKMRRTAMFSATLAGLQPSHYEFYGMRNLAKVSLKPIIQQQGKVVRSYIIPSSLTNTYILMKNRCQKLQFLVNFMEQTMRKSKSKAIIFFNTCASVDFYSKLLITFLKKQNELIAERIIGLHGKLKTNRRKNLMKKFMSQGQGIMFATDVVSRGIDFDRIDYILQVDPPQDPDNYVHRIGRTARVDRPGTAILLLEQHQNTFIQYLQNKAVEISKVQPDAFVKNNQNSINDWDQLKSQLMEIVISDRDYIEKSKKAFVSYIRSYKEHDLKFIFEFKYLNIGHTANSFLLLRIPRVKQILGKKIEDFTQSSVDPELVPWIDKNQELQFLKKREKLQETKAEQEKEKLKLKQKVDIKNNKSQRKKVKRKNQKKNMKQLNKQHKLILKEKKNGGIRPGDHRQDNSQQSEGEWSVATEEIQKRVIAKNI